MEGRSCVILDLTILFSPWFLSLGSSVDCKHPGIPGWPLMLPLLTVGSSLCLFPCPALPPDDYHIEMNQGTDLHQGKEDCKGVMPHSTQELV